MEGPGTGCETEGKTACDERKGKNWKFGHAQQADSMEEEVPEDAQGMNMTM